MTLDELYTHFLNLARNEQRASEFESVYQSYRRRCWARRECIIMAAVKLNLPGQP